MVRILRRFLYDIFYYSLLLFRGTSSVLIYKIRNEGEYFNNHNRDITRHRNSSVAFSSRLKLLLIVSRDILCAFEIFPFLN